MAALAGKNGSVRDGTVKITLQDSWTLNPTKNLSDITSFGSSYVSRIDGLKDWAASISGALDAGDTNQLSWLDRMETAGSTANIDLRLYTSSVAFWYGNVLIDNWSIGSKVNDKVTVSFSMKGNGVLTYTTGT